jgi:hypothetical protein
VVRDDRSRVQRNLDAWSPTGFDPRVRMLLIGVALLASLAAAVGLVVDGVLASRLQPLAVLLGLSAIWAILLGEGFGQTAHWVARLTCPDPLRGAVVVVIWTVLVMWPLCLLAVLLIGHHS